jgi:hypothetical protein
VIRAPLVLFHGDWSGADGDLTGTLVREGDCLYVDYDDGLIHIRPLVTFSARGTSWDEEEQSVRTSGALLRVGDEVALGGGLREGSGAADMEWAVPPDSSCDTTAIWISGKPD